MPDFSQRQVRGKEDQSFSSAKLSKKRNIKVLGKDAASLVLVQSKAKTKHSYYT